MVQMQIKILEKANTKIILAVIAAITILEIYALSQGINGVLLTTVIGVLAMFAGLVVETPKVFRK